RRDRSVAGSWPCVRCYQNDTNAYPGRMVRTPRPGSLVLGQVSGAADLADGVIDLIATGALADGDRLPSTRALAEQAGLSRGTVVRAFDELAAAGFVAAEHGSGTRVSPGAAQAARAGARTRGGGDGTSSSSPVVEPRVGRSPRDLRPGIPDASLVDERAWRAAVRAAAAEGLAGLNRGIAEADPLLFDSSRAAIAALCAAFVAGNGPVSFHMEDPGYRGARLMAHEYGLRVRFHPADRDGLAPARLGDAPAIVFTTPAHQFPLGHRMSVDRRGALVDWVRRTGSLLIEAEY